MDAIAKSNVVFQLANDRVLEVRTFDVRERIGELFRVTLTIVDPDPDLDLEELVGETGRLEIAAGRAWTGTVRAFELLTAEPAGLSTYRLELVPSVWLLTQRTNYRIFQRMTEPEMAVDVLGAWQIPFELRLDASSYKRRDIRVQYAETDFAFVSRALEDAGITYWFETQGDDSVLILSDAPQDGPVRAPLRHVAVMEALAASDLATQVSVAREIRTGKCSVRDVDLRTSPRPLVAWSRTEGKGVETTLESIQYRPGAFLFEGQGDGTPRADDKITVRSNEREGDRLAQRRLEAHRSEARSFRFRTSALDVLPGRRVAIVDHPRSELGLDHPLLVTETTTRGDVDGDWVVICRATRSDVPFRMPLSTPRPRVSGIEMATVVGAYEEEIHTDEFGRVRVHFHWDRTSKMDDESSCWVPVSQTWAGTGFGAINLPRVGQEVVVDFLGGDPDRPIVVGRLHTALQPVPYKLPEHQTQSGWKSNSTGGTGGYNELMFEDLGGAELVRVHAERDLEASIKHDETRQVGRNRSVSVRGSQNTSVGGSRGVSVKGNESTFVGKSATRQIAKSLSLTVGENATMDVTGNRSASATNDHIEVSDSFEVVMGGLDGPHGTLKMTPKRIVLSTEHGASIILDEDTISLNARLISLVAEDVDLIGSGKIDQRGAEIAITAHKTLDLTGTGSAKLASVGPTTVNGTPVQLNGPGLFGGRVTDSAPVAVMTGAALVLVGGPSFPFAVERLEDGTLQVGPHIQIKPGEAPDFQAKVLRDLGIMSSTAVGLGRLMTIQFNAGGHDVTIDEYTQAMADDANVSRNNSSCTPDDRAAATRTTDEYGNPEPGPGSGSTIYYNPDVVFGVPGDPAPPDTTLHHELGHAEHNATGTNRANEEMDPMVWGNREEWQNMTGAAGNDNAYNVERNYPYRCIDHWDNWENADGTPIQP